MDADKMEPVRSEIRERLTGMRNRADRLSPLDIYVRMDAIRQAVTSEGLDAKPEQPPQLDLLLS